MGSCRLRLYGRMGPGACGRRSYACRKAPRGREFRRPSGAEASASKALAGAGGGRRAARRGKQSLRRPCANRHRHGNPAGSRALPRQSATSWLLVVCVAAGTCALAAARACPRPQALWCASARGMREVQCPCICVYYTWRQQRAGPAVHTYHTSVRTQSQPPPSLTPAACRSRARTTPAQSATSRRPSAVCSSRRPRATAVTSIAASTDEFAVLPSAIPPPSHLLQCSPTTGSTTTRNACAAACAPCRWTARSSLRRTSSCSARTAWKRLVAF